MCCSEVVSTLLLSSAILLLTLSIPSLGSSVCYSEQVSILLAHRVHCLICSIVSFKSINWQLKAQCCLALHAGSAGTESDENEKGLCRVNRAVEAVDAYK